MTTTLKGHTLEEVVAFLWACKAKGSHGVMEIIFRGHDITLLRHTETYQPGELPRVSAPSVTFST